MSKISFVKTIIAKSDYKEKKEAEGGIYLIHFDPTEKECMNAYECVECSVSVADYNAEEVKAEYADWKTKHDAAELAYAIRSKVAEIEAYDKSPNVNGVYINGILIPWSDGEKSSLNRNTRMSVRNSTEIAKNAGLESTTLWLGDMKIDIDCDKALKLLDALEMYAMSCFNVTAAHKKAVSELKTIKEVEAFDVTADYPKQLEMKL